MIKTSRIALAVLLSGAAIAAGVGCGSSSDSASSADSGSSSGATQYSEGTRAEFLTPCVDTAVSTGGAALQEAGLSDEGLAEYRTSFESICGEILTCIEGKVSEDDFKAGSEETLAAIKPCQDEAKTAGESLGDELLAKYGPVGGDDADTTDDSGDTPG